jgi:large subunit ribosomal protein L4
MKLNIYTSDGSQCQEKEFKGLRSFEDDKGRAALHQYVKAVMANARQGTACAKDRGMVAGSGTKPYRQKGTGMARHGEKRSPIWVKGGVVFGPKPRDYSQKVNKKVKKLAFQRALFDAVSGSQVRLVEAFQVSEPKTRLFDAIIGNITAREPGRVLIVDVVFHDNVLLAARNLQHVHIVDAHNINPYDLVHYNHIIMSQAAFERVVERSHT